MTTADTPSAIENAAVSYRSDLGWSVIPTHPFTKKPLVKWESYQQAPADEATIRDWYRRWPLAGVAVVTGAVSGLWVVDIDSEEGRAVLNSIAAPCGPIALTGKGEHRYFRRPGPLRNTAKPVPGLDTRGDGGYVVAPPSRHPSGTHYAWAVSPWQEPPPDPPLALVALLAEPMRAGRAGGHVGAEDGKDDGDAYARLLLDGAPEGQRHDAMTRLVGHYLACGLSKREVAILLRPWVDRCRPPFPYDELDTVIDDLAKAEARKIVDSEALRCAGGTQNPGARRKCDGQFQVRKSLAEVIHSYGVALTFDADRSFLRGRCPFHGGPHKDLWIAPKAERWGCRTCGIKSDLRGFLDLALQQRMAQRAS